MVVFHVERMTERKHKGGLCGSSDILYLDLGVDYTGVINLGKYIY